MKDISGAGLCLAGRLRLCDIKSGEVEVWLRQIPLARATFALRWKDVDLEQLQLHVRRSILYQVVGAAEHILCIQSLYSFRTSEILYNKLACGLSFA